MVSLNEGAEIHYLTNADVYLLEYDARSRVKLVDRFANPVQLKIE
jgi:hypothetical protein